jgi:hypothetical protein
VAATSFDVPALLTVLQQTGEGVAGAVLPASMGGSQASLRHLFRPDGFFAYADDRQAQVTRDQCVSGYSSCQKSSCVSGHVHGMACKFCPGHRGCIFGVY